MSIGHLWILLVLVAVVVVLVVGTASLRRGITSRSRVRQLRAGLRDKRECPACKEWMRQDASICPHCRTPSPPQVVDV